ncbi:MAG: aminotransferase class I/II-fold pyridoxal phosphate-dependent enzyme [Fibrobacter sp.]|jgi:aspartate/methionine/tyrosine aminotransferase|nr:aminotransferase class I/II-fold pyridoxal phosphate-dependent enzyme [Fibrobacter sp.]
MNLNALAQDLNRVLSSQHSSILEMLSSLGKAVYFPSQGILGQSAEAKNTTINATIGTALEDDGSPLVLPCIEKKLNLPKTSFLYSPSFGDPGLREAWKKQILQKNPSLQGKVTSLPVVTAALTHALSCAGYLFLDPEDEVIIPDLYWDNYELLFCEGFGARIKTYNTFKDGGFDTGALESAVMNGKTGKKVILLNFPNNPTGYTVTEKEAGQITELLVKAAEAGNKLVVVLDDAYFGLVFEKGIFTESLFARLADAHENLLAVKLDGPTKEDYVWGFRVGFMTFGIKGATPEVLKALENKAAGAVRGSISNAPSISQKILLEAYTCAEYASEKKQKYETLKKRYDTILSIFESHPEYRESFTPMPFNSGYFMCVKPKGIEAEALRKVLLEKYNTGVIVLSGLVRLAFSAVPTEKLPQLFENIHQAVQASR